MNDDTQYAFAVGDTVQHTTSGQQYIVDGFDGDLVVCKWPPAEPAPPIHPDMGPTPIPPDPVRVRFVAAELVKA